MKRTYLLLLIPLFVSGLALNGYGFAFKAGVPLSCVLIILAVCHIRLSELKSVWFVVAAFIFSAAGDWFLSFKGDDLTRFAAGIGMYFFAHIGYLGFALVNGKLKIVFTTVVLTGYLLFFYFMLYPVIDSSVLLFAVLIYLVISCVSLGAAGGTKFNPAAKWTYFIGISLILISDTIISLYEFADFRELNILILPTYYAAQILITFAVLKRCSEFK